MPLSARDVMQEVQTFADPAKAEFLQRFFRTGKGEYAEGDLLLGLNVPRQRMIARKHSELPLAEIRKLLRSKFHEHRLIALMILCRQCERAGAERRDELHRFYLEHTAWVNNWDLVDSSARVMVGDHLQAGRIGLLKRLAKSPLLWERRIAMVATYGFIRKGELQPTFRIAEMLLDDRHDLIHKAAGWMLREAGKQSAAELLAFLEQHYDRMPRTALRYAIERFPEPRRKALLRGEFT